MQKRKKDPRTIALLNEWLKKHSKVELANRLGYTNTETITRWIDRVRVPELRKNEIIKILREK